MYAGAGYTLVIGTLETNVTSISVTFPAEFRSWAGA